MKEIYLREWFGGVNTARYKVIPKYCRKSHRRLATVFVTQKKGDGCSLINSDIGRNEVINKVLGSDLNGVCLTDVKFIYQYQTNQCYEEYRHCWEFFLSFDHTKIKHWREPNSSLIRLWYWLTNKETYYCWHSSDAVAGEVKVISVFGERRYVPEDEVKKLHQDCDPTDPNEPPALGLDLRAMLNQLPNPT